MQAGICAFTDNTRERFSFATIFGDVDVSRELPRSPSIEHVVVARRAHTSMRQWGHRGLLIIEVDLIL